MTSSSRRRCCRRLSVVVATTLLLSAVISEAAVAQPAQPSGQASPVLALRAVAPSDQVRQAVARFRQADPSASFTFFRGHVDAFAARPKQSIPDYAKPILERLGLPTTVIKQPNEQSADQPDRSQEHAEHGKPAPGEASSGDVGFAGPDDPKPDPGGAVPTVEAEPEAQDIWYPQSGREAVRGVLTAFLARHRDVFEIDQASLHNRLPSLRLVGYGVGRHFRRAEFSQVLDDMPLLDGKTVVLFDLNWNVINISRQIIDRRKLELVRGETIAARRANAIAARAMTDHLGKNRDHLRLIASTLGVDAIRGILVWQVKIDDTAEREEFTVTLDGRTGEVVNVSDDTMRYTDAMVRRWDYANGDYTDASQVVESNVYTHDDNSLVHDFFYVMNDDRNNGQGFSNVCVTNPNASGTLIGSDTTPVAYNEVDTGVYIRPTLRADRDFSVYLPRGVNAGSFGESHIYYWARRYMLWQKQALIDQGVLTTGSFNNYEKVLIIVNACHSGAGSHHPRFDVQTLGDVGEGLPVIVLPEVCRAGNPRCRPEDYDQHKSGYQFTYEGDGGYHSPGVLTHELNHFILRTYLGVPSTLDCDNQVELQFIHEGGLGRTLPQMFWHNVYSIGYNGPNSDQLFQSEDPSGRPHVHDDPDTLNVHAAFPCVVQDWPPPTGSVPPNPYQAGGVLSQPMWEIYHGVKIDVDAQTEEPMPAPARDLSMIRAMYYAADMTSASVFKNRFEFANRFMEFWEFYSGVMPSTKESWCAAFEHHSVSNFINAAYCN
jgi:hypothetical protein